MKNNNLIYVAFAAISIFVSSINTSGNYIIHFIDIFWPVNMGSSIYYTKSFFFAWSSEDFGMYTILNIFALPPYLIISFLYLLHIPTYIQEITLFSAMQFMSLYFFFRIFNEFILFNICKERRSVISFFSAIAITFNYPLIVLVWWDNIPSGFLMIGFGSAFLFYLLSFSKTYLEEIRFDPKTASLMFLFSALSISVNIPFNLNILYVALIFLIYSILFFRPCSGSLRRYGSYVLVISIIILLSNLWWVLPNAMYLFTSSAIAPASGLGGNIRIYEATTSGISLLTLFRGLYAYSYIPFFNLYSGKINNEILRYGYIPSYFISVIIILQCISPAVVRRSTGKAVDKKFLYFLISILPLVSIMVGSLSFHNLINYLFGYFLLQEMLRNPIVSFAYALIILLVILVSTALGSLLDQYGRFNRKTKLSFQRKENLTGNRIIKKWAVAAVVFLIVFLPFFSTSSDVYTGYAIPHYPYRARMVVPAYENNVANFLEKNLGNHYVLLYPGGFIEQNTSGGYIAYDILPSMLSGKLVIDGSPGGLGDTSNHLLSELYSLLGSGYVNKYNIKPALEQFNIKYIVIEGGIGGKYPWGSTSEPDYNAILSSLNHTSGLKLVEVIGIDYIYQNSMPGNQVTITDKVITQSAVVNNFLPVLSDTGFFFNSSLFSPTHTENIVPEENITKSYFNYTLENLNTSLPHNEITPIWKDGIFYSLNYSERMYLNTTYDPLPLGPPNGQPSLFNAIPMDLNATQFPTLLINFSTNKNTVLNFQAVTSSNLTQANLSNSINLGFYTTLPSDPAVTSYYGGMKYNGTDVAMTVNLLDALQGMKNMTLNYLIISIYPTYENGSGMRLPITEWPGYQNFTIHSIQSGHNYLLPISNFTNLSIGSVQQELGLHLQKAKIPLGYYIVNSSLVRMQVPANYSFRTISTTQYTVFVELNGSTLPFMLILDQNYYGGWILKGSGISHYRHVLVDGSLNGFLVYPSTGAKSITLRIVFAPQHEYMFTLLLGLIFFISFYLFVIITAILRRKK